jgi:hypothetical protein
MNLMYIIYQKYYNLKKTGNGCKNEQSSDTGVTVQTRHMTEKKQTEN